MCQLLCLKLNPNDLSHMIKFTDQLQMSFDNRKVVPITMCCWYLLSQAEIYKSHFIFLLFFLKKPHMHVPLRQVLFLPALRAFGTSVWEWEEKLLF